MTVLRRELPPAQGASPPGRSPSVAEHRRGLSNRASIARRPPAASGCHIVQTCQRATPPGAPGPASGRPRRTRRVPGRSPPRPPGAVSHVPPDAGSRRWSRCCARHAWARTAGGWPWLRRTNACPRRGGCRACQAASTRIWRAWVLPAWVMLPRRARSPVEASLGTRPR